MSHKILPKVCIISCFNATLNSVGYGVPLFSYQSPVAEIMGFGGEQLPPSQFDKTRKFSVEVGNFEGGIETAMKKRVTFQEERISILNEQTKC